jgi:serine/threonine-protein kinase
MFARRRRITQPMYRSPVKALAPRAEDEGIPLSAGALELVPEPVPVVAAKPPPGSIALLGSSATPARIRQRYRVMNELGRGAMGVVYRAYDENLEREVAIKVMSEQLRDHAQALVLFASEGKMLAQLNHPNIVAIYDQIGDRDEAMLVMELVEGITLDRALAKCERYGWRGALQIVDQLCAGLAYAHEKNVIHRDIKPPNIFITPKGDVKLGDFGLARVMRALAIRSTELRGTPMYMAPEQITGAALDQRVDLYAVGCTLFELLAGRPVFTEGEPMFQHVSTPPPDLGELVPGLPPAVSELVAALIAKAPDDRPASAEAVRTRIATILA